MKVNEKNITVETHAKNRVSHLEKAIDSTQAEQKSLGPVTSIVVDLDARGYPIIEHQGKQLIAETTVVIGESNIGQRCLIVFPSNQIAPVLTGLLIDPISHASQREKVIDAQESITLSCGKSSLTLESNGSVQLKGVTVTTQAYGSNRVKGAAVKIN